MCIHDVCVAACCGMYRSKADIRGLQTLSTVFIEEGVSQLNPEIANRAGQPACLEDLLEAF